MRLVLRTETIETTRPGDEYRTYAPGRRYADLVLRIPGWLARALYRSGLADAA